ncbi:MAG: hypothetical protein V4592_14340 [Bacteroidota bacterium]
MKKMNDEELQKLLFDVLSTEPAEGLPYDFSARVTRRVQAKTRQNSELRLYIIAIAVVSIVITLIYGLFFLLKPQLGSGILTITTDYKWTFVLGIFGFLTIQYLDQVLLKSTFFKSPKR